MIPNPKLKLLDQVREVMRLRHYSFRTERSYCDWIRIDEEPVGSPGLTPPVKRVPPAAPRGQNKLCPQPYSFPFFLPPEVSTITLKN